jgi:hypothetical protein
MKTPLTTASRCRPVVYIAVHDVACRSAIVDALHRQGWAALEYPTGYHLIEAAADLIDGAREPARPGLIVVDAVSRGCAGTTIAAGLSELGVRIPIALVTRPGDPSVEVDSRLVHVVPASTAASAIAELARPLSPAGALDARHRPIQARA